MKNEKPNEKYSEIFKELKSEKMNWDFEDFLKETEKEKPIQIISKKKSASFSKLYWMAASVVLLASLGVFFSEFHKKSITEQDEIVKNEILKQKPDFGNGEEIVAVHTADSLRTVRDSIVTDSATVTSDDEIMDKILPARGRLKKQVRQHYVSTPQKSAPEKSAKPEYQSNYVIINGQKIESEKEAIDLTKYSFRILSENVSKTVAKTEAIPNFINE
ncbi:hypothetical protein [Chryseobacterium koreense]|uniref:hypothetical protein n=1 Tax=Chryseobacterium koreense TaxID=232216 RepID=UPI0026EFFA83|nr:hypothetical protein [Chryseobacterium koreense]